MASKDEDATGGSQFVIDYEVESDSPPDAQRKAITAARLSTRARVAVALTRFAESMVDLAYNPGQKRDARGRWVKGGGAPAIPRASEGGGAGTGGGGRRRSTRAERARRGPLTEDEFQARADHVDRTMSSAIKEHSTDRRYAPGGVWTSERDRLHREIADDLYAKAADVPNDGKAVMAGGLGGAGKSTVLRDYAGIDSSQYLTVNPDDVKEELVRRGLVPEVPGAEDLSPLERSALVHEESSRIAQMVAQRAYADSKNIIWDITMSSQPSIDSRVSAMREAGYGDISGVFVDIPTETSVDRAMSRYRRGIDDYLQGKGNGGRYVPPRIIRAQQTAGGRTVNRDSFDSSRGQFDGWSVYDNSVTGRAPQLVDRSGGVTAAFRYDPRQKRDPDGKWGDGVPGSVPGASRRGGNTPTDIRDIQEYLDGGDQPLLPLPYLLVNVDKEAYRKHFTPEEQGRILKELRGIRKDVSSGDREDYEDDTEQERSMIDKTIKALEELLAEDS